MFNWVCPVTQLQWCSSIYTYILRSHKDDKNYIGYTNNLRRRIEEHNRGKNFSTKPRLPMKLIYFEACLNEDDAKQREKYFKSTIGRRFLKKRLRRYFT
ncbi:GIY-YIG nuclease family protein [Candidatus Wolfebacteria bacterium]|nr:GIY-YIG nuclease family protein [Candidatus Wolfebacteria bacterium]